MKPLRPFAIAGLALLLHGWAEASPSRATERKAADRQAGSQERLTAPAQGASADASAAGPMAGFARMATGEWRMGTLQTDTWSWGPGGHSMRMQTRGSDGGGNPWSELLVVYWHPGRRQVRLLGLHPDIPNLGRGVMEGTIRFDGGSAASFFDLYQPGRRRDMSSRWTFDGPDKYRETLLEDTGSGFATLAEWDFVRSTTPSSLLPRATEEAPTPSENLAVFATLLGPTWAAEGDRATGESIDLRSTFECVPHLDVIHGRVTAPAGDGAPAHLLDVYLYHHVGTGSLHCLALSKRGGVFEGELAVLADGALQVDLRGSEDDRVVPYRVRVDLDEDEAPRQRIWSLDGSEPVQLLDVRHRKLADRLPSGGRHPGTARDEGAVEPPGVTAEWYEVVSQRPGHEVTDATMRRRIEESGHPWKVRDRATGIEMVLVMPGEFMMGSPESERGRNADEGPRHRVRLTRAFYLGATEVTQAQWRRSMGSNPAFFPGEGKPVESVSWREVQAYLARANDGIPAGREPLRPPTEAEWEYACRAGTTGPFGFEGEIGHAVLNFCDGDARHAQVVNGRLEVEWERRPAPECRMTTAPAGSLPPNAWGLHEMHGNLWEWCDDMYAPGAYAGRGPVAVDPVVRAAGDDARALRGGSWYDDARLCRSAVRDAGGTHARSNRIGFRVARTVAVP
jgi:formylglycine-generating enzyme required for sulfatase activity